MSQQKEEEFDPRQLRRKLDLNQQEFWSAVGVTQSGGSRYEQDRRIPKPVLELLKLRYEYGICVEEITKEKAAMIRAIIDGELDPNTIRARQHKIERILAAGRNLVESAKELSEAAHVIVSNKEAGGSGHF